MNLKEIAKETVLTFLYIFVINRLIHFTKNRFKFLHSHFLSHFLGSLIITNYELLGKFNRLH